MTSLQLFDVIKMAVSLLAGSPSYSSSSPWSVAAAAEIVHVETENRQQSDNYLYAMKLQADALEGNSGSLNF